MERNAVKASKLSISQLIKTVEFTKGAAMNTFLGLRDRVGPLLGSLDAKVLSITWILGFLIRARKLKLIKAVPFSGLLRRAYLAYPLLRSLPQILQTVAKIELENRTGNFSTDLKNTLIRLIAYVSEQITTSFAPQSLIQLLFCFIANKVELGLNERN
jgi:hypothetical protein